MRTILLLAFCLSVGTACGQQPMLRWDDLPKLPNDLGVAGPFVGVHRDALLVAGGANFPRPVWENEKVWTDQIYALTRDGKDYQWHEAGKLPIATAYGAAVTTSDGVVCIGGNDSTTVFDSVFLLQWDPRTKTTTTLDFPSLPTPLAFGAAAVIKDQLYVAGGQIDAGLDSATSTVWTLDLSQQESPDAFRWTELAPCPFPDRAFNLAVAGHNGYDDCLYVISGRRQNGADVELLRDVWEYNPAKQTWRQRADAPRCVMAAPAIGIGHSHVAVLGGDDGALFGRADDLRDDHPGFINRALLYHTITDAWADAGEIPANQVTTIAARWGDDVIVASGEVRPRVRSPAVFQITAASTQHQFGTLNYVVLFGYLLSMVGVGFYYAKANKNTDDFFRGGKHIPWWAAGCSIFATMLSSLTYTGVPSKAFAQDWVYAVGNFTIPVVAIIAVYIALPFFRRIDATSAYEYLELRFNRTVRWFGSASFTLFHLFRMGVVMSLTGLALSVAIPLTPVQSVLLMGVLSILYCTMGGIEAVIWTDTIQTVVLLSGAMVALVLMLVGTDSGATGMMETAAQYDKFRMANLHLSPTSAQIALWVIIVGAIAQNTSSYTADQAVVQRYMTTSNERMAARSIWTYALLSIPATLLFFGIGTALFAFYRSHPEKLNPAIATDQIFPWFIAREMPVGLAGLIVAGVFAAAQSTVSTSMNSTATTIVTDFLRPMRVCKSERGYLNAARGLTLLMGVLGTTVGLVFVDPNIRSLLDTFLIVIGLFMGVLGGLFVLGITTRSANATGALTGAILGAGVMFCLWSYSAINGYLYTACGITTCFVVGYVVSRLTGGSTKDLTGLTLRTSS